MFGGFGQDSDKKSGDQVSFDFSSNLFKSASFGPKFDAKDSGGLELDKPAAFPKENTQTDPQDLSKPPPSLFGPPPTKNPWTSNPPASKSLFPASKFGPAAAVKFAENDIEDGEILSVKTDNSGIRKEANSGRMANSGRESSVVERISPKARMGFNIGASKLLKKAGLIKKRLSSASNSPAINKPILPATRAFKIMRLASDLNSEEHIRNCLEQYGKIVKITCKPLLNYAFVEFDHVDNAKAAYESVEKGGILASNAFRAVWAKPSTRLDDTKSSSMKEAAKKSITEIPKNVFSWKTKISERMRPSHPLVNREMIAKPSMLAPQSSIKDVPVESNMARFDQSTLSVLLNQLVGKKATTHFDKYQLLEERDKIIRKCRQRVTDVEQAEVVSGSCYDMCPEKERYQMQVQQRLSPYEMDSEGNVIDRFVIKDYSRSSADQEEPLAHELRPGAVLRLCMDYLMHLNLPETESHVSVWYDFLWNRTRGIRKELNQQMLNDDVALLLVENCARFHAFAAHRLCDKPPAEFDHRMNTENLSKSLQTLRHFYEDRHKRGECTQNEHELRAIDVMLRLDDSNIMTQVLSYSPTVRRSDSVKLALKLFLHKQSNNYAAFFRLVKDKATFLQSCILHRYFDVVRTNALQTMIASHQKLSQVLMSDIVRVLGFDSTEEAVQFCAHHNMSVSDDSATYLVLDKAAFALPDPTIKQRLSHKLVASKMGTNTIGEIINGCPVSRVQLHNPHSSFDESGIYSNDPVLLQFTGTINKQQPQSQHSFNHVLINRVSDYIINEELNEIISESTKKCALEMNVAKKILDSQLPALISFESAKAIEFEKEQLEKRELEEGRLRKQKIVERVGQNVVSKIFHDTIEIEIRECAAKAINMARTEKLAAEIRITVEITAQSNLEKLLMNVIEEQCQQFYVQRVLYPIKKLARIKMNLRKIWLRFYADRWRIFAAIRGRKRRILENFPTTSRLTLSMHSESGNRKRKLSLTGKERTEIREKMREVGKNVDQKLRTGWEFAALNQFGWEKAQKLKEIRERLDRNHVSHFFSRWIWAMRAKQQRQNIVTNFASGRENGLNLSNDSLNISTNSTRRLSLSERFEIVNEWSQIGRDRDSSILEHTLQISINQTQMQDSTSANEGIEDNLINPILPKMQFDMKRLNSAIKLEKIKIMKDEIRWKQLLCDS